MKFLVELTKNVRNVTELKDYLLRGYAVHQQAMALQQINLRIDAQNVLNGTMSFHRSRRLENNNDQPLIEFL